MAASYYKILGVGKRATAEEIKRAYRQKAKASHPDVNPSPGAADAFVRINEAYEILSDPKKRQIYDLQLRGEPIGGNNGQRARQHQQAYQQWVRTARAQANQHARMSYEDFRRTRFSRTEATIFLYLQFLIIGFIFLMGAFIMAQPFLWMVYLDWKMVFLALIIVPVSVKIFREGYKGFQQVREALYE